MNQQCNQESHRPAPVQPPVDSLEAAANELVTAAGHHYIHSSLDTRARLDKALEAVLRFGRWNPMDSAPKDGSCVRLLIKDGEHPMQDDNPSVTIGSFGVEGGPVEDPTWHFVGWSWHQDCYCRGIGTPVGWRPLI